MWCISTELSSELALSNVRLLAREACKERKHPHRCGCTSIVQPLLIRVPANDAKATTRVGKVSVRQQQHRLLAAGEELILDRGCCAHQLPQQPKGISAWGPICKRQP